MKKLKQVDCDDEFNNVKASMVIDEALVNVLKGKALKIFLHQKDEYHGKGFKKLAMLKAAFAGASRIQVAREMFTFFQDFPQGDSSLGSYEADLCKLFEEFDMSRNPISKSFQVMFMVRSLREDYGKILLDFQSGQKKFDIEDLESITA